MAINFLYKWKTRFLGRRYLVCFSYPIYRRLRIEQAESVYVSNTFFCKPGLATGSESVFLYLEITSVGLGTATVLVFANVQIMNIHYWFCSFTRVQIVYLLIFYTSQIIYCIILFLHCYRVQGPIYLKLPPGGGGDISRCHLGKKYEKAKRKRGKI